MQITSAWTLPIPRNLIIRAIGGELHVEPDDWLPALVRQLTSP